MGEFDFNKLDRYKNFMLEEGIHTVFFIGEIFLTLREEEGLLSEWRDNFYSLRQRKDGKTTILVQGTEWSDFKIEVANKFLEGDR